MTNGHRTHPILILFITMSGELCLNATRHFKPKPNTIDNLKKVLQTQNCMNKTALSFIKRPSLCESWGRTL